MDRTYLVQRLRNMAALDVLSAGLTDNIFSAGRFTGPPKSRPFISVHQDPENPHPAIPGKVIRTFSVWVHDEPGDYTLIRSILTTIRTNLTPETGYIGKINGGLARWQGDSGDQADDAFNTIVSNGSYQFIGQGGSA